MKERQPHECRGARGARTGNHESVTRTHQRETLFFLSHRLSRRRRLTCVCGLFRMRDSDCNSSRRREAASRCACCCCCLLLQKREVSCEDERQPLLWRRADAAAADASDD